MSAPLREASETTPYALVLPPLAGVGDGRVAIAWAQELRLPHKLVGNAFQVKGSLANIDDLKKAIKTEMPHRVLCDAIELDIYRQVDGEWLKEKVMSAPVREASETTPYAFVLPTA